MSLLILLRASLQGLQRAGSAVASVQEVRNLFRASPYTPRAKRAICVAESGFQQPQEVLKTHSCVNTQ